MTSLKTSFGVMKERHGTGRYNPIEHQQKLNNLKPKYRINHKGNLKMLPYKKTQRKANIQKKPKKSVKEIIASGHCKIPYQRCSIKS